MGFLLFQEYGNQPSIAHPLKSQNISLLAQPPRDPTQPPANFEKCEHLIQSIVEDESLFPVFSVTSISTKGRHPRRNIGKQPAPRPIIVVLTYKMQIELIYRIVACTIITKQKITNHLYHNKADIQHSWHSTTLRDQP